MCKNALWAGTNVGGFKPLVLDGKRSRVTVDGKVAAKNLKITHTDTFWYFVFYLGFDNSRHLPNTVVSLADNSKDRAMMIHLRKTLPGQSK